MAKFKYRNLLINLGKNTPAGCREANWPDSCHVMTCFLGSQICGIPSTVGTIPVGDELRLVMQAGTTVENLRADLKDALRELDELEKKQVDVAALDELSAEIDAARRDCKG